MRKVLTLIFLLISGLCLTQNQILIKDIETNFTISNVHIINDNGELLLVSDRNGKIVLNNLNTTFSNNLTLRHIGYENYTVSKDILLKSKTVFLIPKVMQLKEFEVSNKKPYYLKVKGYYRIYQTNNKVPYYYTDGIINYYIPVKKRKKRVHIVVDEYRIFYNDSLYRKTLNEKRSSSIGIGEAKYPYLTKSLYSYDLKRAVIKGDFIVVKQDTFGSIHNNYDNKTIIVSVDLLAKDSIKTLKMFGYEQNLYQNSFIEVYKDSIDRRNLLSFSKNRKLSLTHKRERDTTIYNIITEFTVIEKSYIYNKDRNNETNYIDKNSSYYSKEYWKNFDVIPYVNSLLYDKLIEKKNVKL